MNITIADIARRVGANGSTVSRVLNHSPTFRISERRRQRIVAVARRLGYQPRHAARSLATGRTFTIGAILGTIEQDLCSPFFSISLVEMNKMFLEQGYTLCLLPINLGRSYDEEVLLSIQRHKCDGFFVGSGLVNARTLREICRRRIPAVVGEDRPSVLRPGLVNQVKLDLDPAMRALARALAERGHRRVAYVVPSDMATFPARLECFRQALTKEGIRLRDGDILTYHPRVAGPLSDRREADQAAEIHLKRLRSHTAIAGSSDLVVLGVGDALRRRDVAPGRDVALIGYDNIEASPSFPTPEPFLTTIDPCVREKGRRLAELLLHHIRNPGAKPATVTVTARLVVRESLCEAKYGSR